MDDFNMWKVLQGGGHHWFMNVLDMLDDHFVMRLQLLGLWLIMPLTYIYPLKNIYDETYIDAIAQNARVRLLRTMRSSQAYSTDTVIPTT